MPNECHYVVCLKCYASRRTAPTAMARTHIVRGTAGQFAVRGEQPDGCPWCGERKAEVRWGVLPATRRVHPMVAPAG
jgi:hypothetical protein